MAFIVFWYMIVSVPLYFVWKFIGYIYGFILRWQIQFYVPSGINVGPHITLSWVMINAFDRKISIAIYDLSERKIMSWGWFINLWLWILYVLLEFSYCFTCRINVFFSNSFNWKRKNEFLSSNKINCFMFVLGFYYYNKFKVLIENSN